MTSRRANTSKTAKEYLNDLVAARRKQRRSFAVLAALSAVVFVCVGWQLRGTGLSFEGVVEETSEVEASYDETVEATDSTQVEGSTDDVTVWSVDEAEEPADDSGSVDDSSYGEDVGEDSDGIVALDADEDDGGASAQADGDVDEVSESESTGDLTNHMSKVSLTNTSYDSSADKFSSTFSADLSFSKSELETLKVWTYTLPSTMAPIDSLVGKTENFYDSNGKLAGTYIYKKNANGTYTMTMTFNDDYVANLSDKVEGKFTFDATIDKSAFNEKGEIVVPWKDGANITVDPKDITWPSDKTVNYDIETSKSYDTKVTDKLTYTVYVNTTKGTPDPITLTDVLTTNGITVEGLESVTVSKSGSNWQYTELAEGEYSYTYADGTTTYILPSLAVGERYKIEYTYKYSGLAAGNKATVDNKVTAEAKDETTGEIVKDSANTSKDIDKTITMAKTSSYDASTGLITWTITLNENGIDLDGYVLTDPNFPESVTVSPANSDGAEDKYAITSDENGKVSKITFHGSDTYTITYQTEAEDSWEGGTVSNTATLEDKGGETAGKTTGTATVTGGSLAKTMDEAAVADDGKTSAVTWTVTVNLPSTGTLESDTVIMDSFSGGKQWMTQAQVEAWGGKMTATYADRSTGELEMIDSNGDARWDITFTGSDGKTYTYAEVIANKDSTVTYTNMKITLNQALNLTKGKIATGAKLAYTYATTADISDASAGANSFTNRVEVGSKSADATYTYYKGGVKKTDGKDNTDDSTVENSDGTLTWKIQLDVDSGGYKTLTLTDTLPKGVTLTGLTLTNALGPTQYWGLTYDATTGTIGGTDGTHTYSGSYDSTTGAISITITPIEGKATELGPGRAVFTVTCKVDGAESAEAGTKIGPLTNSVEVSTDKGDFGSDEQSQTWTKKTEEVNKDVLTKTSSFDSSNQRMEYQVVLNPEAKDLKADSDTVTVTDVFEYVKHSHGNTTNTLEMELLQSTVKLYTASYDDSGNLVLGDEVTNWSWSVSSEDTNVGTSNEGVKTTITATVPDSQMLVLKYAYSVDHTVESGGSKIVFIWNTVSVDGGYSKTDYTQNSKELEESHSSAEVWTGKAYTFYKVSTDNYGNVLAGAEFTLYKWDAERQEYVEDGTFTTGDDGMVQIHWQRKDNAEDHPYSYNTAYYLVETKAPKGYVLPDEPTEYYFEFKNEDIATNPKVYPDGFSGVDLSSEGKTAYVENATTPSTSITVQKKWQDASGADVTDTKSGSVSFKLYQLTSDTPFAGSSSGGSSSSTATVTFKNPDTGEIYVTDKVPVGATIAFTVANAASIPCLNEYGSPDWSNQIQNTGSRVTEDYQLVYCYSYTVTKDITFGVWSQPTYQGSTGGTSGDETSDVATGGTLYTADNGTGIYTVSSGYGWSLTIDGLPKSATVDGKTVYYGYYVVEDSILNYTTSYADNLGIGSGTITITNTATENPEYTLPKTGGTGVAPFVFLGSLLCVAASLAYLHVRRRDEGRSTV